MYARFTTTPLAVLSVGALAACNSSVDSNASGSAGGNQGGGGSASTGTHQGGGDTGGGQGTAGGGASMPAAYPAKHPGMPQIPNHGGDTLHDPVIVTVTWPGDTLAAQEQDLDDNIGTYAWWPTWANDYGVGRSVGGGHVELVDPAPASMSDTDVQAWLDSKIQDGTMPAPTDQMLYALYVPASTTITIPPSEGGGQSCSSFLGYHNGFVTTYNGQSMPIAYAVINNCGSFGGGSALDGVTETASHEIAEACSDPHPFQGGLAYMILDNSPWTLAGGENADMCSQVSGVTENGYSLTRVWSNSNAKKGDQPCVPVPPDPNNLPYFNAGPDSDTLFATPGETVTTKVHCYSFGPLPGDMTLTAQPYSPQSITITFDKATCKNGDVVTMSIAVSASAMHATDYHYDLLPSLDPMTGHLWRGMVHVN